MEEIEQILSHKDLEQWLTDGKVPEDIGEFGLSEFKKAVNLISEFQKLKDKGIPQNQIISKLQKKEHNSKEELEKGLALFKFVSENRDAFKNILGEDKRKKEKFRQSGHLIDQSLKYTDPKKSPPLTLFDLLSPETKEKIVESRIEIKAEGIRLTPVEDKIIKAINKLLHEKSEHSNITSDEFYSGNAGTNDLTLYGGNGQKARPAMLRLRPAELYKAYLDKDDYSGQDIKFIKKNLYELSQKKFLIIYDRKRKVNGKNVTDRIEDFQNLIKIVSYIEGLSDNELEKLDAGNQEIRERKGELIIGLNPIFIDQITTKYIEFPSDINKRTSIAAGGHFCVTESMIILRDYMLRELSNKRYVVEINEEKLPFLLRLENYIKNRKKKLVNERIEDAINTVKNLGIIKEVIKTIGAQGQPKYIFHLNKEFE